MQGYHRNVKPNKHLEGAAISRSSYHHIKIFPQTSRQNQTHHQPPQKISKFCME